MECPCSSPQKGHGAEKRFCRAGDFFGLQHSPFPIRPCRKSARTRRTVLPERCSPALDNGHVELGGKIRKRPFEQGSLSRAGGTDEVQGKNAVPGETFLQTCRQFFVGLKNVANNWYFHEITPLFHFHALDIEFPSRFYGVPLFFSTERARCRKTFLPSGGFLRFATQPLPNPSLP